MPKIANLGFWLALASPVAFSFFNAGVRLISQEMTVFGLLLLRGWTGLLLVCLASLVLKKRPWAKNPLFLCLIGFLGALSTVLTTSAFTMIPLYQAVVILYLYPSQSVILSAMINREGISLRDLLGLLVAFAGCLILVWPSESAGLSFQLGHLLAFLGGAVYALSIVLTRRLKVFNSGLEPIFFYSLFAALSALPLALLTGQGLGLDSAGELVRGSLLGLLGSTAQLLAYAALRFLPPYKVGVIGTLEILGSALFSLIFFGDKLGLRSLIGGLLIIYAAFGFHQPQGQKKSGQPS
ncbi:MAG: DMT family transporter [Deltaproteobacteria bacterium]|jgi:drug/metabolite transporter (DMT)-like permease|nr:DMT family transporter [Deltaproteobacteria bacterium]